MSKIYHEVISKCVKLRKLEITGHDFTNQPLSNLERTITISRTAPVITVNKLEEQLLESIAFDANDLPLMIEALTKLQAIYDDIKNDRIKRDYINQQINTLMNDVKSEQKKSGHWMNDIFYSHHNNYMCLKTAKHHLNCFINIKAPTSSETAEVFLKMQKPQGGEAEHEICISYNDMKKAYSDINEAITALFLETTK